ncbi:hypothetical protein ACFU6I_30785 [Streptomyces sp. NPDC057486]|uniref:hypothetical protein n=1 Tax=Streptomyces sp. NPDC057486 TaxID=3346145 RepID=UPI0036A49F12
MCRTVRLTWLSGRPIHSITGVVVLSGHVHLNALHRISVTDAAAWHRVVTASMAHDLPGVPPPGPGQIHAQLTRPALDSRRLTWLATGADGVPVGVAGLRLFTSAGRDAGAGVPSRSAAWQSDALGFRSYRRTREFQLDVPAN